ncbi:MAG TPA: DNA repair protein RecO [Candidatus Hydrogenedens sp.]|nr:DNA repair protein RecO [Candidatus Hydrogenedens sp.]
MPTYQTEAFVVHLYDYSETSKIVQFLTAQQGKLSCIAKGLKRKNNPWVYALDRLNRVEIFYTWKSTREVQTLTDVNLIDSYPELKKDIQKQVLASLILETAFSMTETEQVAFQTYNQVQEALSQLNNADIDNDMAVFLTCWHLWRILAYNGIEPQLQICIHCGKAVQHANRFSWKGGVVCQNCPSDRILEMKEIECLQTLKNLSDPLSVPVSQVKSIYNTRVLPLLCTFIIYNVGHPLKSYNVFCEIINPNQKGIEQ